MTESDFDSLDDTMKALVELKIKNALYTKPPKVPKVANLKRDTKVPKEKTPGIFDCSMCISGEHTRAEHRREYAREYQFRRNEGKVSYRRGYHAPPNLPDNIINSIPTTFD